MLGVDSAYDSDNLKAPTVGDALQTSPDAATTTNQSGSQTASEKTNAAEIVEDREPKKNSRKRKASTSCQICQVILKDEKPYYQRYRICPTCSSIDRTDSTDGLLKRFCQQCGKFHNITLFDGTMRTCRERLHRHAACRRKSHARQAEIRRGSPRENDDPSRHDRYSLPPQGRQYTQVPRYDVQQQLQQYHVQQQEQVVSNPMLDLAHQILQSSAAGQSAWEEQQRALQHYEQQQQMLEYLMTSMACARPSPPNLFNPLCTPTPLRFSPSPHPQKFVDPSGIDPITAATRMKAVLALLLNETAAAAAPPPPPPPPQPQNGTQALQSMLQRLVAITSSASGGNETDLSAAAPVPSFAAPALPSTALPANSTPLPSNAATLAGCTNTTSNATADVTETTSDDFAMFPSSLPPEVTELAPQLRAALEALMKHEEEQGKPQRY